ncbi:MAG TPA: aldehyde dehydrogenase family protein [Gaiellaceae bacterium]|jgi:acyl-CoA reductase-like NAD-dependent aldehyde dehydrogenase|nr:aldehyde dehydrogenase family protein [Gaiellaceae bacterium]
MATTATDHPLLIDGEHVETGEWIDVLSPYSGELIGRVAKGAAAEAKRALDAAERAMREPLPAHERARILDATAKLLEERQEEAAQIISAEAGKPLKAARVEAQRAISTFTFAAVEARKLAGEVVPMDASAAGAGKLAFTLRLPIGIVGAISPFNFPLNLVAHKIAPSLAAGCAVVLKPASATPLAALFLAGLEAEAGLPPGWLNVVAGSAGAIGDVLVDDERVKLITFTGSGAVGWGIAERAHRKRVKLELGNATPAIVMPDAPEGTATKLAANAFSFAGQSCISVQRIYLVGDAWDGFVQEFVPAVEALNVGDPSDPDTDVGPVIAEDERTRILEWIEASKGDVLTGGAANDDGLIRPTVIANPSPADKVQCEEVFGPVVTLTQVASLDEAIEQSNATRYGLQAAIFSSDVSVCLRAARELEFGGVTVNEAPTFRADQMPYGGVKASGNTKEGPAWAVHEMTEERLVVLQL